MNKNTIKIIGAIAPIILIVGILLLYLLSLRRGRNPETTTYTFPIKHKLLLEDGTTNAITKGGVYKSGKLYYPGSEFDIFIFDIDKGTEEKISIPEAKDTIIPKFTHGQIFISLVFIVLLDLTKQLKNTITAYFTKSPLIL